MDFTNQIWSYLILVVTVLSLIFVFVLALANRKTTRKANETTGHVWDEDLMEYDNPLPAWWLYLLYLTVIFSIIYLILYPGMLPSGGVLGWTQIGQYETEVSSANESYSQTMQSYAESTLSELSNNTAAMKTASRLFSQNCALCHGADARGAPGIPNLRDEDWIYENTPEAILKTVLEGRVGIMPGWEQVLGGPDGTADVTNYVLQLSGEVVNTDSAKRGKKKFDAICIACHGADGKGNKLLGGMNLTDQIWVHGGSFEQIADVIANGVTNEMPAHKDIVGETRAKLLAAYVLSFSI